MVRSSRAVVAPLAAFVTALVTSAPVSSAEPALTFDALAHSADLAVAGRVTDLRVDRDATGAIYTFVHVAVSEWLKGPAGPRVIVVKQLGGRLGGDSYRVNGQARFSIGEEVVLFLDIRPRDGSIYTSALWQGKWTVDRSAAGPAGIRRHGPGEGSPVDVVSTARAREVFPSSRFDLARITPDDGRVRAASPIPNPPDPRVRWNEPVVLVHRVQDNDASVDGGGQIEVAAAVQSWNGTASGLILAVGPRLPSRCVQDIDPGTGILVIFDDPCGEISNNGNLLALTVVRSTSEGGQVVNNESFERILDAFITTSQHPAAQALLGNASCLQSRLIHEVGHAIGLGNLDDPSAAMFASETQGCAGQPLQPGAADRAALHQIYPVGGSGAGVVVTSVVETFGFLTVTWTPAAGATGHRLDFFAGMTPVATVAVGGGTSAALPIPPGTTGSYTVRVTPIVGGIPGATSAPFPFTLGGSGPACGVLPAPIAVGSLVAGTGSVSWQPVTGAVAYVVQAGTTQGGSNLLPSTNVGAATSVGATGLPPGFTAWVRVVAVNACGQPGTPRDVLVQ